MALIVAADTIGNDLVSRVVKQAVGSTLNTAYGGIATEQLTLDIYTGTAPSTITADPTGTQLFSGSLANASTMLALIPYAPAIGGVRKQTASVRMAEFPMAAGTAGYFRLTNANIGTTVAQGTVGTATGDMLLNTVTFTTSSAITITNFNIGVLLTNSNLKISIDLANMLATVLCSGQAGSVYAAAPVIVWAPDTDLLTFYDGTAPATADAPATGNVVASIPVNSSTTGLLLSLADGVSIAALAATKTITPAVSSTITYARMVAASAGNGGRNYVIQFNSVGTTTSFDIRLSATAVTAGTPITLQALSFGM